mmetsp:Transcript_5583/g.17815  ORF Transcript_5583/g.17815 Transcript_5583/m.17815 type:complete len:345 (-) Transcript_5583:3151-4185(-)
MTCDNYTLKFSLKLRNYLSEFSQSRLNVLKFFLFFLQKIFKFLQFYFEYIPVRNFFFQNKRLNIKDILKKNNHIIELYQCNKLHLDTWGLDVVYKNFSQKKMDYEKIFNQGINNTYLSHNKLKTLFRFISKPRVKKLSNLRAFQKVFLKKKSTKKKFIELVRFDFVLYFILLFKFHKIPILYFFLYSHFKKLSYIFIDMKKLNLILNIKLNVLNQFCLSEKPDSLRYDTKNFCIFTSFSDLYYEIKTILYKLILHDVFGSSLLKLHMKNVQNTTIYVILNIFCYFEYVFKNVKIKILNMINLYEIFTKYNFLCKQFIPCGDFYCFFFRNKLRTFFSKKNNKIIN